MSYGRQFVIWRGHPPRWRQPLVNEPKTATESAIPYRVETESPKVANNPRQHGAHWSGLLEACQQTLFVAKQLPQTNTGYRQKVACN